MKIIEEIYFGSLEVNGKIPTNKAYLNALHLADTLENSLINTLEGENKKQFLAYANAWGTINGTDCVENFNLGFKLGMRLALEALGEPLDNCIKE